MEIAIIVGIIWIAAKLRSLGKDDPKAYMASFYRKMRVVCLILLAVGVVIVIALFSG